ncbi:hypothetical protein ASG29_12470 [Sphingomonas sp. Leaf412]|nr:hypothetical protein ASG29_12470 [Sphingomonas sp. Leaf412]
MFGWVGCRFAGAPAALFALDAILGTVVRTTRTPILGQMRLTWWRDALLALDAAPAPAHPVLQALHAHVLPRMSGATLAGMTDGWELLTDEAVPDDAALLAYAQARGTTLFRAIVPDGIGDGDGDGGSNGRIAAAGRGWALADLAANVAEPALAQRAGAAALAALGDARGRWHGPARAIGALAADAALAVEGRGVPGGPRRSARAIRLLLTGR